MRADGHRTASLRVDSLLAEVSPSVHRSERTIDSYLLAANQLSDYLAAGGLPEDAGAIEADHVRGFLSQVLATRASATARQRYASLKQLFKWLWEGGEIPTDPMERVKPPKVSNNPSGALRRRAQGAHQSLRKEALRGPARRAIVRLFIHTGMRLGELAGLTLGEVDLDLEVAVVVGKGRRLRSVPFGKADGLPSSSRSPSFVSEGCCRLQNVGVTWQQGMTGHNVHPTPRRSELAPEPGKVVEGRVTRDVDQETLETVPQATLGPG
jgi:site-specific recombinase XerC